MQERIIELESKFSFQEDTLQELNEIIIRQQRQLDEMARKLGHLSEQIADIAAQRSEGQAVMPADEKPPHY